MEMITGSELVLFLVIVFLGAFLQSVIGFGGNFFSVGILALWLPARDVIVILAAVFALNNLMMVWLNRSRIQLNTIRPVIFLVLAGGTAGSVILPQLQPTVIYITLGITIIGLNLLQFRRDSSTGDTLHPAANTGLLLGGGIIQGAIGTGGPLIVTVLAQQIRSPRAFRGTANVLFFLLNAGRSALYIQQDLMSPSMEIPMLAGMGSLVIATLVGHRISLRIPETVLRKSIAGFLIIIGIAMVGKTLL